MDASFEALSKKLATTDGGYTLWIGAGASIAATNGKTPSWTRLVNDIEVAYGLDVAHSAADMPSALEAISCQIGHSALRRELKRAVTDNIAIDDINLENIEAQCIIGTRAASLVSFNIEPLTALPLTAGRGGGSLVMRTFLERSQFALSPEMSTQPGLTSIPVYFPHGVLLLGNVVITQSEYTKYQGSIAVTTAVHMAIGGDLVILGMSLADAYLRGVLLQHRNWVRHVYWIGDVEKFSYREWARVAEVTLVEANFSKLWTSMADIFTTEDTSKHLLQLREAIRPQLRPKMIEQLERYHSFPELLRKYALELLSLEGVSGEQLRAFMRYCIDAGFDIPAELAQDSRIKG